MIRLIKRQDGQATLEFVVVSSVVMIVICALALLVHMAADGRLAEIIDTHASHDVSTAEGVLDVAAY